MSYIRELIEKANAQVATPLKLEALNERARIATRQFEQEQKAKALSREFMERVYSI